MTSSWEFIYLTRALKHLSKSTPKSQFQINRKTNHVGYKPIKFFLYPCDSKLRNCASQAAIAETLICKCLEAIHYIHTGQWLQQASWISHNELIICTSRILCWQITSPINDSRQPLPVNYQSAFTDLERRRPRARRRQRLNSVVSSFIM